MKNLAISFRLRAFTLIEMLVVLAIIGVLGALTLPLAEISAQRDKEQQLRRALWSIRDAIDSYKVAREQGAIPATIGASMYPAKLQSLTVLYTDARPQFSGRQMRFLREVPRDPFADAQLKAEDTWALRSFQSEADKPLAGADVYDVRSSSAAKALDGTWLKDW